MNEYSLVLLAAIAGVLLGIFYYGTLWMTVRYVVLRQRPLLLLVSFVLRAAVVVAVFVLILQNGWYHLIAALAGFILGRLVSNEFVKRSTSLLMEKQRRGDSWK